MSWVRVIFYCHEYYRPKCLGTLAYFVFNLPIRRGNPVLLLTLEEMDAVPIRK